MQDVALRGSAQTGTLRIEVVQIGRTGVSEQSRSDQYGKVDPTKDPCCAPEPRLVKYLDVLVASYGERAVRTAAEVLARGAELPQGSDVDSYQARMLVTYFGRSNRDAIEACETWLRRREGLEVASSNPCVTPQDEASLKQYLHQTLAPAYGEDVVRRAATAWLDRCRIIGADTSSRQAAMLVAYFNYLDNPPVVGAALRAFVGRAGSPD